MQVLDDAAPVLELYVPARQLVQSPTDVNPRLEDHLPLLQRPLQERT